MLQLHHWSDFESPSRQEKDFETTAVYMKTITSQRRDHLRGCLYGQVVGDALGTRYEFKSASMVRESLKKDTRSGSLPILGGGPFDVIPGQITDDSELALTLARVLPLRRGFQLSEVVPYYQQWFLSRPFDIGRATRTAFGETSEKLTVELCHQRAKANRESLSNGALMRISPMGMLATTWNNAQIWERASGESSLTHPSPIVQEASVLYVMAIRDAIEGYHESRIMKNAMTMVREPLIKRWLIDALERPCPVFHPTLGLIDADSSSMGYVGIAFQNAFHQLLHGGSFKDGLIQTILLGGDTDTNGCIAGALLGAYYGAHQIPKDWIDTVRNCRTDRQRQYPACRTDDLEQLADSFPIWET